MKQVIISLLFITMFLGSCEYLDYDEKTYLLKDDVYSDIERTRSALTGIYTALPSGFTQVGNAMLASACDEAVFANDADAVHKYYNGAWSAAQPLDSKWNLFVPIRRANRFLVEVDQQSYEDYLWDKDPTYETLMTEVERFKMEARALRAYYYFELAKRYGDVPLITTLLTEEEANQLSRTPFQEVIEFIVQECDSVAPHLPKNYADERLGETGRITQGAAMAIKARALLYAASPLHNPDNDVAAWQEAAEASISIIDSGLYSLSPSYSSVFNNYKQANPELILERRHSASNSFERINFPVGYVGGSSGNCPTQNLVDAYEMEETGLGIDEAGSGFDPVRPFQGRDSRLASSILYNGASWKGQVIEAYNGGANGQPLRYATPTGYYLKKYVIESINLEPPNVTQVEHTWVLFRYAEVLLNYAEAMNEVHGPEDAAGLSMTALAAVNEVRQRAGMPEFPAGMTKDEFREKLRNERRVELAFEEHRFWDIRRWMIGDQTTEIYGVNIGWNPYGGNTYENAFVEERVFEEKMYLYPIPQAEIYKNSNLGQNPGW